MIDDSKMGYATGGWLIDCPDCEGVGVRIDDTDCPRCKGAGCIEEVPAESTTVADVSPEGC